MGRSKYDNTLKREFVIREDLKELDNYEIMIAMTNYRNLFYNMLDTLELTSNELSLILFAYPYRFFSREAMKQRLRMNVAASRIALSNLIKKGYIREYSAIQMIETEIFRQSEVCNYTETIDKVLPARFCLSQYGKTVCTKFFKEVSQKVLAGYPFDERMDNERYKFF